MGANFPLTANAAPDQVIQDRPRNRVLNWLAKPFTPAAKGLDSIGTEKGLKAFVASLPVTDPVRTVAALGAPFEMAGSLNVRPDRLRRALKHLDERAQEYIGAVLGNIFDVKGKSAISDTAWLALTRYYRDVHSGYRFCLDALPARESLNSADREDCTLLAGRAMAALARHKALLRLRYRETELSYWEQLNSLAAWRTELGDSETVLELYPRGGYHSSVEREYLIALMFEAAPVANMVPNQVAALDTILRQFAEKFQFSDRFRTTTPFVLDTACGQPPRRWLKGFTVRPGQRFFGVGEAYADLTGLLAQARASVEAPAWLAKSHLSIDDYRGLLELLVTHWSVDPPRRRRERERRDGTLLVTHGIDLVRRVISASDFAKSGRQWNYDEQNLKNQKLDFNLDEEPAVDEDKRELSPMEILQKLEGDSQMTERWVVADLGGTGIGTIALSHGGWARVGMLVGYRHVDSLDWRIGVIRRVARSAKGKLSVGLQALTGTLRCAQMTFGEVDYFKSWVPTAGRAKDFHNAILRYTEEQSSVLLEPEVFSGAGECMLSFEGRWRKVRLERVLERGSDYEEVEFRMLDGN